MTEETVTPDGATLLAQVQEQAVADQVLIQHLQSRVVVLRREVNLATAKVTDLTRELAARPPAPKTPQDRRPRTAARKAAGSRGSGKG